MQAEQQSERERFEAWDSAQFEIDAEVYSHKHGERYVDRAVQCRWECWQARAALSHPSTPQGWQPIESAPGSGYFVVYEDGAYRLKLRHDGCWLETAYPAIESAPWGDVLVGQDAQRLLDSVRPGLKLVVRDGCCENPTHYMPLPPPPEQGGKG